MGTVSQIARRQIPSMVRSLTELSRTFELEQAMCLGTSVGTDTCQKGAEQPRALEERCVYVSARMQALFEDPNALYLDSGKMRAIGYLRKARDLIHLRKHEIRMRSGQVFKPRRFQRTGTGND